MRLPDSLCARGAAPLFGWLACGGGSASGGSPDGSRSRRMGGPDSRCTSLDDECFLRLSNGGACAACGGGATAPGGALLISPVPGRFPKARKPSMLRTNKLGAPGAGGAGWAPSEARAGARETGTASQPGPPGARGAGPVGPGAGAAGGAGASLLSSGGGRSELGGRGASLAACAAACAAIENGLGPPRFVIRGGGATIPGSTAAGTALDPAARARSIAWSSAGLSPKRACSARWTTTSSDARAAPASAALKCRKSSVKWKPIPPKPTACAREASSSDRPARRAAAGAWPLIPRSSS